MRMKLNADKLTEHHNEMTRYAFISHMEDYMRRLVKDPLHADTDSFLKEHGIDAPTALNMLVSVRRATGDLPKRLEKVYQPTITYWMLEATNPRTYPDNNITGAFSGKFRHLNGMNILHFDGHVSFRKHLGTVSWTSRNWAGTTPRDQITCD